MVRYYFPGLVLKLGPLEINQHLDLIISDNPFEVCFFTFYYQEQIIPEMYEIWKVLFNCQSPCHVLLLLLFVCLFYISTKYIGFKNRILYIHILTYFIHFFVSVAIKYHRFLFYLLVLVIYLICLLLYEIIFSTKRDLVIQIY